MIQSTPNRGRQLVQDLIREIQDEGLSVGDRLPSIRQLADKLGAGVNAVRDALMQAQTLGLVQIRPRSGAFVQSLNYAPLVDALSSTLESSLLQVDHNLFHLLEARQTIEAQLVDMAARRRRLEDLLPLRAALEQMSAAAAADRCQEFVAADVRFHLEIARIAGNSVLSTMLQAILSLLRPYLARLPWTAARRQRTERSHAEIYQALVDGDPERARRGIDAHLGMAYESLLARVQSLPESGEQREAG